MDFTISNFLIFELLDFWTILWLEFTYLIFYIFELLDFSILVFPLLTIFSWKIIFFPTSPTPLLSEMIFFPPSRYCTDWGKIYLFSPLKYQILSQFFPLLAFSLFFSLPPPFFSPFLPFPTFGFLDSSNFPFWEFPSLVCTHIIASSSDSVTMHL